LLPIVAAITAGCANNTAPRWELRHDRIIAVRTTPAHVSAGGTQKIDAFVTSTDAGVAVELPIVAAAAPGTPASLAGSVVADGSGGWQVVAPDETTLDAARNELGIAAGAPIPLELQAEFEVGGQQLGATKTTWLGDSLDNPMVGNVTVDSAPPPAMLIVVPFDQEVMLAVDTDPMFAVNWLTSCGSLNNDDNEHAAILHVRPGDSTSGELAVVVRDTSGGVAWKSWPTRSQP
jgi:hypothetical protein